MKKYIEVPPGLTVAALEKEFGAAAVEDRRTGQGFWTTYRGHTCRRKKYGGS